MITYPPITTHNYPYDEERLKTGISDSLIRASVGLELVDDIIEDIENGL